MGAIRKAIAAAKARTDKPTLIRFKAIIGYGPPNTANNHDAHGLPITVHLTCCIMDDGCLQEGISRESGADAGHLGLEKVIAFGTTTASPSTATPCSPSRRTSPSTTRPPADRCSRCRTAEKT